MRMMPIDRETVLTLRVEAESLQNEYAYLYALGADYPPLVRDRLDEIRDFLYWHRPEPQEIIANGGGNMANKQAKKEYYTIAEVAKILGRTVSNVHYWIKEGKLSTEKRELETTQSRPTICVRRAEFERFARIYRAHSQFLGSGE